MSARQRFEVAQPWVSLVVRLAAASIMVWAGILKMLDVSASVRATRAYRLLPESVVPAVGTALPFLEILLGFFLIGGLLTRWTALAYLAMMAAFIFGISWAWAHGLEIDCGCFGGGGDLPEGETTDYVGHLWERVGFVALGAWLAFFPRSAFSVDNWLRPSD